MASKEITYKEHTFKLSYELVNPTEKKALLVLHGWGSNKEIMKQAFKKALPEYKHIYLDMPGFGKSTNNMELTTEDYGYIVQHFLKALGVRVSIAIGHSFGGKVATLLNTPCLVLLSSSGILVPKVRKVRLKISLFEFLKPFKLDRIHQLILNDDAKNMPRHMYETFRNVVNEDYEHNFTNSRSKALIFWGKNDTATPLWSGRKIAELMENSVFYPLDGDHFFFLQHKDFVARTIAKQCTEYN